MAFVNLPPNLQDMFNNLQDQINKLTTGPNEAMYTAQSAQDSSQSAYAIAVSAQSVATVAQVQAINAGIQANIAQSQATIAQSQATIASTQATTALTTADGKNSVYYSTSTPGTTANKAGDIWYQYGTTGTYANKVIAQWSGAGGTSWNSVTVSGLVIANIDAGSITTGTLSAIQISAGSGSQAFTVSSTGYMAAQGAYIKGNITADSGTFNGTINATAGAFGTITGGALVNGWSIGATGITGVGTGAITGGAINGSVITGGTVQTSAGSTAVKMVGSTNSIDFIYGGTTVGKIIPWTSNGIYISYGSGSYPASYVGPSTAVIAGSSTIDISSASTGNAYNGTFTGYGDFNITSSYELRVPFAYNNTTTNAATVWISSTGQLRRSTASSERYKTDIVNLADVPELNPQALYDLPVRAFRFKPEYLANTDDRADLLVPGFIAEEVDAVYPIAADYLNNVETWNDRMLVPALLALIQEQNNRIKILEGK